MLVLPRPGAPMRRAHAACASDAFGLGSVLHGNGRCQGPQRDALPSRPGRGLRAPRAGEEAGGAPGTLAQHKLNPLAYSLLCVDGPWVNGILVRRLWSVAGRSSSHHGSLAPIE